MAVQLFPIIQPVSLRIYVASYATGGTPRVFYPVGGSLRPLFTFVCCFTTGSRFQVEKTRKTAAASVVQVRIVRDEAHRATQARACALANAVGVKIPRILLGGCAVGNKTLPPGTDGIKEMAKSKAAHSAATAQSHHIRGKEELHTPLRSSHHHGARSHRPGGDKKPTITPARSQEGEANDRRQNLAGNEGRASNSEYLHGGYISPQDATSKGGPRWTAHQREAAPPRQIVRVNAQKHVNTDRLRGFTREWCKEVDIWCLQTSSRYRQKVAHEVVRSARRLAWLQGERRAGGGSEALAALAAFGDVPDLLELSASMGELTVSVEEVETKENGSGGGAGTNAERAVESSNIPESRCPDSLEEHPPMVDVFPPPTKKVASGGESVIRRENIVASHQSATDPAKCVDPAAFHHLVPEVTGSNRANANKVTISNKGADDLLPRLPRHQRTPRSRSEPLPVHREESEPESESTNGETNEPELELPRRPPSRATSYPSVDIQSNSKMGNTSATADKSTLGTNRYGGGTCEEKQAEGPALRGYITLNPSSLEALLGVPPLSAAVLRAGRLSVRSFSNGRTAGSSSVACNGKDCHEQGGKNPSRCAKGVKATGVSQSLGQPASCETGVDNVEWPSRYPHGGIQMTERERKGLRDVVEFLVLPRISVSTHKSVVGSERTLSLRLAPPSIRTASGGTSSAAGETVACTPAGLPPGLRRFLHGPVLRWVSREGGGRCLMSCPASTTHARNLRRSEVEEGSLEHNCRATVGESSMLSADTPTDGILASSRHKLTTTTTTTSLRATNDSSKGRHEYGTAARTPSTNGSTSCGETCVPKPSKETWHTVSGGGNHHKPRPKHGRMTLPTSSSGKPFPSNTRESPHTAAASTRTATALTTCLPTAPPQDNIRVVSVHNVFLGVVRTMDFSDKHLENNVRQRPSVGIGFDRPLCCNCGRRSLRRLETTLLVSADPGGRHHARVLQDHTHQDMARNHLMSSMLVARDEVKRVYPLQAAAGPFAETYKGGRFADWKCLSGVALCSPCLRILRASELPYQRLDDTRLVHGLAL